MRILHLSRYDIVGGAARAAYRLHIGLQQLGQSSQMLVLGRQSDDTSVAVFKPSRDPVGRIKRHLRRRRIESDIASYTRPEDSVPFTDDRTQHGGELLAQLPPADIITLHWVARLIDYRSFFAFVPSHTPIVWRIADMAPFTGGCHYDGGCGRFAERCGHCPQLGSRAELDLSRAIWRRKQTALGAVDRSQLHLVALSRWMASTVRESSLLGRFPVTIIPNGLDLEELAPRNRLAAREVLGVPADARVVLFVAERVDNPRKGFRYLARALAGMTDVERLFLLSVGLNRPEPVTGIPGRHLGYIDSSRLLSLAYSAADLFVVPSLEDNFPNTAVEAMACGTPVVGFEVGGLADIVRRGTTGDLVPLGDTEALRTALTALLGDNGRRAWMATNCRQLAESEYALMTQTRRYIELYRNVIEGYAAHPREVYGTDASHPAS